MRASLPVVVLLNLRPQRPGVQFEGTSYINDSLPSARTAQGAVAGAISGGPSGLTNWYSGLSPGMSPLISNSIAPPAVVLRGRDRPFILARSPQAPLNIVGIGLGVFDGTGTVVL